jgi:hypothetical protein
MLVGRCRGWLQGQRQLLRLLALQRVPGRVSKPQVLSHALPVDWLVTRVRLTLSIAAAIDPTLQVDSRARQPLLHWDYQTCNEPRPMDTGAE